MTTLSEAHAETPRALHLRAYLVGTGATGALVAGALIVFLALATYVAFNGIPLGGDGGNSGTSYVGVRANGTPAAAATALRAAPGAVAANPVRGAPIGAGGPGAGVSAGAGSDASGGGGAGAPSSGGGTVSPGSGGSSTGSTTSSDPSPSPSPTPSPCTTCAPPSSSTSSGVVGNTVSQVDNTVGTNVSGGPVGSVSSTVDNTVTSTVNDVGGVPVRPVSATLSTTP